MNKPSALDFDALRPPAQQLTAEHEEWRRRVMWRVDRYAENENELFLEGYEEYRDTRTNEIIAHPYMGIYEFQDGKIARWRDYFELNNKKQG
jgi:limonene-1,2-epoxide hydrolase